MSWLKRIRGTLGTGVTWAVTWALGGVAIGVGSVLTPFLPWDRFFAVFDAPLPALAVPGFVGGVLFALVLQVAARRTRFADLSMPQFAALGAFGGLLLTGVPILLLGIDLLSNPDRSLGALARLASAITLPFALLGAVSAAGSLWIARRTRDQTAKRGATVVDAARATDSTQTAALSAPATADASHQPTRGHQSPAAPATRARERR